MVALRRILAVNCRRCGRSAERVRRADDLRTSAQLLQSGRCGYCRARACDGEVDIVPVDAPINKHPGFIVEPDGELHPRSRRNGGFASARPKLTVIPPTPAPPVLSRLWTRALMAVGLSAGAALAITLATIMVWAVISVGSMAGQVLNAAVSPPARELTYDFASETDRTAYCHGRGYLINIRGADVPENVRELRRNVIRQCPELAALR